MVTIWGDQRRGDLIKLRHQGPKRNPDQPIGGDRGVVLSCELGQK